ncbi:MAG TPA: triose-phosphate isomerase [Steroidobacteraceae bacterium]|jgi:triosephosphate isomerase|nr:triose-phosphate isomerase [Steroidobacteraceae bacterium]
MRRKLVAGNWKMHGSRADNSTLVEAILAAPKLESVDCVVCPPFVYLAEVARLLRGSAVRLGAQNVSAEGHGAYTGEVAASMLKDVGCDYVVVGHSERRHLCHESNEDVARKFSAAQSRQLLPILCVGEQLAEREAQRTFEIVGRQLEAVVALTGVASFAHAVVAYEPVWAIGTGRTASPEQAQEVHAFIRQRLAERDAKIAGELQILYGGSVKAGNARELFTQADVDGGLIGGASLKAEEFLSIVAAARG